MHSLNRHCGSRYHISTGNQALLSATRSSHFRLHDRRRSRRSRCSAQAASTDLSAGLLETVATTALRYRLKRHDTLETSIQCNIFELLTGAVSGVQIRGTGWESRAGLTARVLEISLGPAQLDVEAALIRQRIELRSVPKGSAKIVFTARDFGHFLAHPLMREAAATAVQGSAFDFDPHSVQFNAFFGSSGAISFAGTWTGNQQRYQLSMVPLQGSAQVTSQAAPADTADWSSGMMADNAAGGSGQDDSSRLISQQLTQFFSRLTINLQGIQLTYDNMVLTSQPAGAGGDVLELFLKVAVLDFPPPDVAF